METPRINIGLLHDTDTVPAWLASVIEDETISGHVTWTRVHVPARHSLRWAQGLFNRLDRHLFSRRIKIDAFRPVRCQFAMNAELDDAENAGLSLLIDPSPHPTARRYPDLPVWCVAMSETGNQPGDLPSFWEILETHPVTGAHLDMLISNEPEGGGIEHIDSTWATTYLRSPLVNHSYLAWSAAEMLKRQLHRLVELGEERFATISRPRAPDRATRSPGILDVAHLTLLYMTRLAAGFIEHRRYWEQWVLRQVSWRDDGGLDLEHSLRIDLPPDEFWADPFLIQRDGITYAFFEIYRQARGKGHLAVGRLAPDGHIEDIQDVLVRDYHLSYPHLVEADGRLFMVPETKENQTIELYECVDFPRRWEFRANLMENVRASDTTFLLHDGRWWMFTCITNGNERSNQHLHIYSAESLLSCDWVPHPCNPVLSDARGGRPGGAVFVRNGKLYRPAQNCSYDYGYGLILFEIVTLTMDEFIQVEALSIDPSPLENSRGIHSIAVCDEVTLIDSLELCPLP